MTRRRAFALAPALVLVPMLSGCPDAQRGEAIADERVLEGGTDAPGAHAADADADAGAAVAERVKLASVSGQLAVAGGRVFVRTPDAIVIVSESDGGVTSPVVTGSVAPPILADEARVYYVQILALEGVRHDGTSPRRLSGDTDAHAVALDGPLLYFATNNSTLRSIAKDASDAGTAITVRALDTDAMPILVSATARYLVLCTWNKFGEQRIVRRPKNDVTAEDEVLANATSVRALKTHTGQAYWLDVQAGIRAVDVEGAAAPAGVVGARAMFDGDALALDVAYVYWTSRTEGRVYRARRASGTVEIMAEGFDFPDESVHAVGLTRGGSPGRIVAAERGLYVSDRTGVYRLAKP